MVSLHNTVAKANEMLVQESKKHGNLRRTTDSSGWDLGHGPDHFQVTLVE